MNDYVKATMADMRAHDGKITHGPLAGLPHLILRTRGARTGEQREVPVAYSRDGARYIIAATKSGAPTNPAWYHNLVANPDVTIEVDGSTLRANAVVIEGEERDSLWKAHVERLPHFGDYPMRTSRRIPVIALEPTEHA